MQKKLPIVKTKVAKIKIRTKEAKTKQATISRENPRSAQKRLTFCSNRI